MKMKSVSLLLAIVTNARKRSPALGTTIQKHLTTNHPRPTIRSTTSLSSSSTTTPPTHHPNNHNRIHGGIPIGAVQIRASQAQNFREVISKTLDTTKNRGVERFIGPRNNHPSSSLLSSHLLLIHLTPTVASAFDDERPELMEFLKHNDVVYLPGLRRSRTHRQATRWRKNANLPEHTTDDPSVTTTTTADKAASHDIGDITSSKGIHPPTTTTTTTRPAFKFSELFAGIGGFRLGLEAIGGTCVMANEIDPYASSIYRHNFGNNDLIEGDILDLCANVDMPSDIDILTAGFPCQPFSTRGKQRGLDDSRGQLYRELVRVLKASKPKSFLFENVAGLVTLGGGSVKRKKAGPVFQTMLQAFEECGYHVTWNICNSKHYVAQQRERVYMVGMRTDLDLKRTFDWEWYEQMLITSDESDTYSIVRDIMEPPESSAVAESELSSPQWRKLQEIHSNRLPDVSTYASINLDAHAPTLISSYRRSGSHTSKYIFTERDGTVRNTPRFLTPRECCRLQGFPEDYEIPSTSYDSDESTAHFYAGIGNAVVPPVVGSIGQEIIDCLRSI